MQAKNVKMNALFGFNDEILTRVLFEGKPEVLYRCTMNIAALTSENVIVFIPLNESILKYPQQSVDPSLIAHTSNPQYERMSHADRETMESLRDCSEPIGPNLDVPAPGTVPILESFESGGSDKVLVASFAVIGIIAIFLIWMVTVVTR